MRYNTAAPGYQSAWRPAAMWQASCPACRL